MGGTYRHGVSDEEIAAASQKVRAGDNFTRQQRDYWQEQAMRYERERDEAKARIEALEKVFALVIADIDGQWATPAPKQPACLCSYTVEAIRALMEKE